MSKALENNDQSGFDFSKEMLAGDPTYGINFDRVQWDRGTNMYCIIEYLLTDERQFERGVTPFSSHPNRYYRGNKMKFISLWELSCELNATLYLVNYSKKGTEFADQVKVMKVTDLDDNDGTDPVKTEDQLLTRAQFSDWLRILNSRGQK